MIRHRPARAAAGSLSVAIAVLFAFALPLAAGAAEHTVTIDGFTFSPANLEIQVGDTVTWTNDGGFHNVDADDGSFGSGDPSSDLWEYSSTFHEGGSYPYHCDVHVDSGMVGTIVVEGIFGDGLESGDVGAWDSSTNPVRADDSCCFSAGAASPSSSASEGTGR